MADDGRVTKVHHFYNGDVRSVRLLIYAAGEGEPNRYETVYAGKTIEVASMNLTGRPVEILGEVDRLAKLVRNHAHGSMHEMAA